MKIFTIDTEGWTEVHESLNSIENSLEFIDVSSNEYIVIDDQGFIYKWNENSERYSGFELERTADINTELLSKLKGIEVDAPFKI